MSISVRSTMVAGKSTGTAAVMFLSTIQGPDNIQAPSCGDHSCIRRCQICLVLSDVFCFSCQHDCSCTSFSCLLQAVLWIMCLKQLSWFLCRSSRLLHGLSVAYILLLWSINHIHEWGVFLSQLLHSDNDWWSKWGMHNHFPLKLRSICWSNRNSTKNFGYP